MFLSFIVCHLIALCSLNSYHALQQLPKDIAPTEEIRDVVNQIFSSLRLKKKKDSKLAEYSTIHKHFVGLSQLENESWKRVSKLTTTDSRIDNRTTDLTTIINDILNDESNAVESNGAPNDEDVSDYVEDFLSTLARLKETYLGNDSYNSINTDVLEHFYRNRVTDNLTNNHTTESELDLTGSNNNANDFEFWAPIETRRIYKGKRTKIKYFPFLASVHLFDQFTCAGSIIDASLIITAASCLQLAYNNRFFRENPAFLAVRIGSPFFNAGGERIPVLEVYFHPSYSPRTLKNNLAIMRLERLINFRKRKRNVRKIDIDRQESNLPVNSRGVMIAGWGAKTASNKVMDPWTNKVSMAHLPIYPFDECREIYSKQYVTRKNFCAGFLSEGGGACNRDVGAPGVAEGLLMGIASFGAPRCGTIDAPTVFTKIGFYYDWIETIMEQHVPRIRIKTTMRPRLVIQNVAPPTVKDERNFKIAPIGVEEMKRIVDIRNLNRLRMDEQKEIERKKKFENFLGTMFNTEDQNTYDDEHPNVKKQEPPAGGKATTAASNEGNFKPVEFVTSVGEFDPKPLTSRETDLDASIKHTESEKNVETEEVDDDEVDDKVETSEIKTTPILQDYGLSIELSDKLKDEEPRDVSNDDIERKHQAEISYEPGKLTTSIFNLDPNESKNKDVIDESLRETIDSLENTRGARNLSLINSSQLRELQKIIDESEQTPFDNEMDQQSEVQEEDSKSKLKTQTNTVQKQREPTDVVKDGATKVKYAKRLPSQMMPIKETKNLNNATQSHKQDKLLNQPVGDSIRYKDVIDELNKEHQYEAEEYTPNTDQQHGLDEVKSDRFQSHTNIYDENQRLGDGSKTQVKPERIDNFNIMTNEPPRIEQDKNVAVIDESPLNKKHKQQVAAINTKGINPKRTRFQTKKSKRNKKEYNVQPNISERYDITESKKVRVPHNQAMKPDETLLDIDTAPFTKRDQPLSDQHTFERNSRPKFENKQIQSEVQGKVTPHSRINKQIVKYKIGYDQGNVSRENRIQKISRLEDKDVDKKINEQIDELLKNLDVEGKIGSGVVENSKEEKVIEDDALLTFLLMTDNERTKNDTADELSDYDEDSESSKKEGFRVDGELYKELTHRTNYTDDSYRIMSKSEMYDILADAVQNEDATGV